MTVAPPAATPRNTSRPANTESTSGVPSRTLPAASVLVHRPRRPSTGTMAAKPTTIHGPSSSHGTGLSPSTETPIWAHAPKPRAADAPMRNIAALWRW